MYLRMYEMQCVLSSGSDGVWAYAVICGRAYVTGMDELFYRRFPRWRRVWLRLDVCCVAVVGTR